MIQTLKTVEAEHKVKSVKKDEVPLGFIDASYLTTTVSSQKEQRPVIEL